MDEMHLLRHAHDEGYEQPVDKPQGPLDAFGWFLAAVGWFLDLWPRFLQWAHGWLHQRGIACPDCAAILAKADRQANEVRRLEALLAAAHLRGEVGPVTDADIAVAFGTLETGQKPRSPQAKPVQEPPEPERPLAYEEVIAAQKPKGPPVIPEIMLERARDMTGRFNHWGGHAAEGYCYKMTGESAITTAEIMDRVHGFVDRRLLAPLDETAE